MARSQTFSVSLSLLTKNFQKGVKTIQSSLNNLKMQFRNFAAAFGAGLGLTEVLKNMVDSAKQLDKAQTVLRNVSNGIEAYGENQQFVMGLSKKYNQELTTLMNNYAKFHSAANQANMSMEQQQYIYESLTRASAYYALTADEMNGVMLAINQMISKGKVSSEELRRQLGERLPGAMNLAAKAMKTDAAGLEEMIRSGKLMATELLPLLAEQLNMVTKNLDVDTIQGALARLKNAFTNLTSKLNIGNAYKKILNGLSSVLEYIADNLKSVGQAIVSVISGLAGGNVFNKAKAAWSSYFSDIATSIDKLETKTGRMKKKLIDSMGDAFEAVEDPDTKNILPVPKSDKYDGDLYDKLIADCKKYNIEVNKLTDLQGQYNKKFSALGKIAKQAGAAIKSAFSAMLPHLIIATLVTMIQKFVEVRKELKRIKNLITDTLEDLELRIKKLGSEEVELNLLKTSLFDTKSYDKEREGIVKRLNEMLGTNFKITDSNYEINKAINERLGLLKEEKRYQETLAEIAEKKAKIDELNRKKEQNSRRIKELNNEIKTAPTQDVKMMRAAAKTTLEDENKRIDLELAELNKLIPNLTDSIKGLAETASDRTQKLELPDKSPKEPEDDTLAKTYAEIQDEYNKNLRTLNERKKNLLITEEDYEKELEELTLKTADSILALNDIDENTDAFAKSILDAARAYKTVNETEKKVKEKLEEYYKGVQELYNQYNNGAITHEELETELYNLLESTVKAIAAMDGMSGAAELLADELKKRKKKNANKAADEIKDPKPTERDGTFDYKKTESEILDEIAGAYRQDEENLKNTIKQLEELEQTDEIVKRLDELNAELERTTANAKTMEEAMKFASISEDIKSLQKELNQGVWENFKNIADAAERLTNAIKDVIETLDDPDASTWEKILSIFNALTQVTDTILQTMQMFTQLSEVMDKLKAAEQAYQAVQDANAAKDMANAAASVAASQAEATGSGTAEAAKMPFPYNLLAIAAVVGTIAAVFASLPKFAGGGIVQGNSTFGDHNIARVNAGEMILNKQQQATLFNMLNNGGGSRNGGGNVEFKIRGSELVGVLKNYNMKIKG